MSAVEHAGEQRQGRALLWLAGIASAVALPFVIRASLAYPGRTLVFLLFNGLFAAAMLLAIPSPRSHAYTFLACMLALGHWAKLLSHLNLDYRFIEPFGRFDAEPASWDRVLLVSSCGAAGLVVARAAHLWLARQGRGVARQCEAAAPRWYSSHRRVVWTVSVFAFLTVVVLNAFGSIYQIGMRPRIVLPWHLNVPLAWMIILGFALWLATLLHWERAAASGTLALLWLPHIEAMAASVSMLSRSAYLFRALPYMLVPPLSNLQGGSRVRRARYAFALSLVIGVGASFVAIQAARSRLYTGAPPRLTSAGDIGSKASRADLLAPRRPPASSYWRLAWRYYLPRLIVDRWIGLEGVMAVSSWPGLGPSLLWSALLDDPKEGVGSLYQHVAGTFYEELPENVFLTTAGLVGLLFFSGSYLFVLAGTAIATAAIMIIELTGLRLTGNPMAVSVAAMALANSVAQLNFPYLTAVFFAQTIAGLAVLAILQRGAGPRVARSPAVAGAT